MRIAGLVTFLCLAGSGSVAAVAQSSPPSSINPASPEVLNAVRSFYEYSRRAVVRVDTARKDDLPGYTRQKLVFARRSSQGGVFGAPGKACKLSCPCPSSA